MGTPNWSSGNTQRRKRRVWAVVAILVTAFVAYVLVNAVINPSPDPISLSAEVRTRGQFLVVRNNDDAYWTPVFFTINDEYHYTHDMLASTGEIDIRLHDFITDDGVRFNPQTHEMMKLHIFASDASYEDGRQPGSWLYLRSN